jgi:hypothetical protein
VETTTRQLTPETLPEVVRHVVNTTPVLDLHTHLFSPEFGDMGLWGIDELLTYHYLVAEYFRYSSMSPTEFWKLEKPRQAELIWQALFIENPPLSEATRGILTVLQTLGLDVASRDLAAYRDFFRQQTLRGYIDRVFGLARVQQVVMTNDPFDPMERETWLREPCVDERFKAVLRLDPLLMNWDETAGQLAAWGYSPSVHLDSLTFLGVRRFLEEWVKRMQPVYMAVSLPPTFHFPEDSPRSQLIKECVLPVCQEHGLPFAMMIGVRKQVNPELRLAGDSLGLADVSAVEQICERFSKNRFLVTMLSLENQHALCVAARKFRNLLPFGCWWFLNNPSIVESITRMRVELLGTSFVPQHSDARVLDQLIYKWAHSRAALSTVLIGKYSDLVRTGWSLTEAAIQQDVCSLLEGNFSRWISGVH